MHAYLIKYACIFIFLLSLGVVLLEEINMHAYLIKYAMLPTEKELIKGKKIINCVIGKVHRPALSPPIVG